MNRVPAIALAVAAGAAFTTAQAQYTARTSTPKVPGITSASTTGGFQGSDDCAVMHTNAGSGDVTGVVFTNGTTGTTGQNEAGCYAFGSTGVDNDVWYDWTATATSTAILSTCNGTGVDTKVAAWPDNSPASCPGDGTSLACNDDACGLQSTISWTASAGTTYTLQIGTFPGASGGSGTFDVTTQAPTACGQDDDGTTENALGLVAGGEMGWIQGYDCGLTSYTHVDTAYGTAMFPGSVTNGANSRIAGWSAPAGTLDPNALGAPDYIVGTVVVNGDTDILNKIDVGPQSRPATNVTWVMATADHVAGQFPGPMDQTVPVANSWVVGSTLGPGTLDINTLANNNVPPMNMAAIGFAANWLLRVTPGDGPTLPGTPLCFGDGSGAPCGCGNEDPGGSGGCLNSLGVGATLGATGSASLSGANLTLTASGIRTQPGLMFQGNNTIAGGAGATFGDGIRCCGQNVVRVNLETPSGSQPATTDTTITPSSQAFPTTAGTPTITSGINPGDKRCYQYWYRDPGGSPCGANFNFSNAVTVTWSA